MKNLLEFKLNDLFEYTKEKVQLTADEKILDNFKNQNALICNLYKYIHHDPIE